MLTERFAFLVLAVGLAAALMFVPVAPIAGFLAYSALAGALLLATGMPALAAATALALAGLNAWGHPLGDATGLIAAVAGSLTTAFLFTSGKSSCVESSPQ